MQETKKHCLIMTACPNMEEADKIAQLLIHDHLAACVQITGITSYYEWEGKVNMEGEHLILIKTRSDNYEKIEDCILKNHAYKIPEIIQMPIDRGSASYLRWIDEVCG